MFNSYLLQDKTQFGILLIVVSAVSYNAMLAFINANLVSINFLMAAGFEFLILISALALLIRVGITNLDSLEVFLVLIGVISAIIISIANQSIFIDSVRNILIIALFVMLGRRVNSKTLHTAFWVASVIVGVFLLIEIANLSLYVKTLNPASYYASTRGVAIGEFNETGLFNNAAGFEGRFGYGLFTGPRTSSIFLEQVSISNFAIILAIYVSVFWDKIETKKRIFYTLLIVTILITARSRSALAITLFALATYYLLPLIPRKLNLLIFPTFLVIIFTVYFSNLPYSFSDTFSGRISHTGHILINFNLEDFFITEIQNIYKYADSGIPYTIASYTLFGTIFLWLYLVIVIFKDGPRHRRFLTLANIYLFSLLMVGAAVFTIKTAALLWLLAGFLSINSEQQLNKGC